MMDVYLVWLERLATALGCTFHWGVTLPSLQGVTQVVPHASLIVNCCGLGAVSLVGDTAMTAVRGVLVLVRCPGVEGVYSDESWTGPELTYIVPKGNGIVACAGCAQPGATSTKVAPEEAQAVLRRCEALLPALAGAPMLSTWAGLRPVRDAVRLETAQLGDGMPVVHNYGHGGSGVVVSWGCAKVVATLAAAHAGGGLQPRDLRAVPQADGLPPLGCAPGVVSRL
jgi:D-amino-acid oxidase